MARQRPRRRRGAFAAALCVVAALFACTGASTVHLDTAPASKLHVSLKFSNLLVAADQVSIEVRFSTGANDWVALVNNQHLTINGQGPASSSTSILCCWYTYKVPRMPTGGQYTIIYTDERGQQTSVAVPAPQRNVAIMSPAAHAQVPIPQPGGEVMIAYAIPEILIAQPPATPTGTDDEGVITEIDARAEGQCTQGHSSLGISATSPTCISVGAHAVYWIGGTSTNPHVNAGRFAADTLAITDTGTAPEFSYANLATGPGTLEIHVMAGRTLPTSGFASFYFSAEDWVSVPITWI